MTLSPPVLESGLPEARTPDAIKAGLVGVVIASAFFWLMVILIGIGRALLAEPLVLSGPMPDGPIPMQRAHQVEFALSPLNSIVSTGLCGAVVAWRLPGRAWARPAVITTVLLVLTYYLVPQLAFSRLEAPRTPTPWGLLFGSIVFSLLGALLALIGGATARWLWNRRRHGTYRLQHITPSGATGPQPYATREAALQFAHEWLEAWNSHDLPRILSHYRDDFEMSSPLIIERGFSPDGVLRGKAAVAEYWKFGLAAQPPLRFELIEVFRGAEMICLLYRSVTRNRRVIEWFRFDEAGLVSHAAGIYGEPG